MTPSKPYLIRALYEWIADNSCTPYVAIDADYCGTDVPRAHVTNGQIVLDISKEAVQHLIINNKAISGKARFGGIQHSLYLPIGSVIAIYAKENQHGMSFPKEKYEENESLESHGNNELKGGSKFQIIKGGKD